MRAMLAREYVLRTAAKNLRASGLDIVKPNPRGILMAKKTIFISYDYDYDKHWKNRSCRMGQER